MRSFTLKRPHADILNHVYLSRYLNPNFNILDQENASAQESKAFL